ncbi:TIGR03826 family flagellar region protein [Mesobacillus jeotgali]|uniref:TIGR03826 family flagellar region protein n=1 Tax=Mesobacillus jeotgali TaxID=129985 RepID=UPI001CFF064B|nr:TIGR03826 family flagellar region protein [Mesobacillus jeotgali]
MDLQNCQKCDSLYVKNKFRDVCEKCWKEEEAAYDTVSKYMRKRENRAATVVQVVEATGVSEDLILKFIKAGRFQLTQFPNFGYPCDKCGAVIREGRICTSCAGELMADLRTVQKEEQRKKNMSEHHATFYSHRD